jgi:deoxyribonuclease-4
MPLFGAHMSVAGGVPRAVDRAVAHRCDAFQVFTKNASQWRGRPLSDDDVREFRTRLTQAGSKPVVSHASYLINLATSDTALRRQSIAAMTDEIDRAEALGLLGVVLHPGCYTRGTEFDGIDLVGDALAELIAARPESRTMIVLEHTAGQGTSLGRTFEQLARMITRARNHSRLGICLDTCHLLASGYDIRSAPGFDDTFARFFDVIDPGRLKLFHLNDSKTPLGSRVDRHEHIGKGHVGIEGFRRLVNDERFEHLPMLLETPKTSRRGVARAEVDLFDRRNLKILRGLLPKGQGRRGRLGGRGKRKPPLPDEP